MNNKSLAAIGLMMLLMLNIFTMVGMVTAAVDRDNYPRLDDMYFKECADEEEMMTKATGGEIDTAMDFRDPDRIEEIRDTYGWTITADPAYSIHLTNFNCRPYYPASAGEKVAYHGRTPGGSGFPLNVTEFRFAMKLLISGSQMDTWVAEIFDWTQVRLDTVITPAHGEWYNPGVTVYGYEPALALSILNGIGLYNTTADTGQTDGDWWFTDPAYGPTIELRQIYVVCCIEAIDSTSAISIRQAAAWDNFFGTGSSYQYIVDESLDWTFTELIYMTFWDRHYDLSSHGWLLGKNPDYPYDMFHPDMDVVYGDNAAGMSGFPEVEDKEYAVKFGRWPNGTFINMAEMKDVLYELQEDLYYLEPFMVTYQSVYANAFAPGVEGQLRSSGYGSDIDLTYMFMYWPGDLAKTDMNPANPGPITSLNPGWVSTYYDHMVTDRCWDGLWMVNPFNHYDYPWLVENLFEDGTPTFWSNATLDVTYGQKVTWKLRDNIYWHFGRQLVGSDIIFAYETMCNLSLPQYSMIVTTFIYGEVDPIDPLKFTIYMNATGPWTIYDYAQAPPTIFPPELWAGWWGDPVGAEAWLPWEVNYDTFTGDSGHGALTCLVGTGPYMFVERNAITAVSHVTANRPDAMWTGNPGYWASNFLREDINFDGIVDIFDMLTLRDTYWSAEGDPNWDYFSCDVDQDYDVDIFDAIRIRDKYWAVTLP